MEKREIINNKITEKQNQVKAINAEIRELVIEGILLSDKEQWFTEENETYLVKRRPKIEATDLVGRIHWNEDFKDEDTGEVITVERSRIVRINGIWQ